MLSIEVFGRSESMRPVAEMLSLADGVRGVTLVATAEEGRSVVRAHIPPAAVGTLLDDIRGLGVPNEDIVVARLEIVRWALPVRSSLLEWADVIGNAHANAHLNALYLTFMFVAGIIGCYGVIDTNGILIVGAMAISPDLLPIAAIAVGVVARSRLAFRGLGTLALGMGAAVAGAVVSSFAQNWLGHLPSDFNIDRTVLGGLTHVNDEIMVVAFFAGVAGMLALETRAMAAIGVAISVTTIPAAAYLGVTIGIGETGNAPGALAVLGVNVVMMVIGGSAALLIQRITWGNPGRSSGDSPRNERN